MGRHEAENAWWLENGWAFDLPSGTWRNDKLSELGRDGIGSLFMPPAWPEASGATTEVGRAWIAEDFSLTTAIEVGAFLRGAQAVVWATRPHLRGVGRRFAGDPSNFGREKLEKDSPRSFAWYGIAYGPVPGVEPLSDLAPIPEVK